MRRSIQLFVALGFLPVTSSFFTSEQPFIRSQRLCIVVDRCRKSYQPQFTYLALSQNSDDGSLSSSTILVSPRRTWTQRKPGDDIQSSDSGVSQSTLRSPQETSSPTLIQQALQQTEMLTNVTTLLQNLRIPRQQEQQQQSNRNQRQLQYLRNNLFNFNRRDDSDVTMTAETRTYRSQLKLGRRQQQRRSKMKPMPVRGYDAAAIEDYYDLRPLEVGWRLNSLGLPLLGRLQTPLQYCFSGSFCYRDYRMRCHHLLSFVLFC
jgi:hypothetical protein